MTKKLPPQKKKKKPSKRKKQTLWGLEPRTFKRGSRYFVDQDYTKDLSDKDKKWLSTFNEEYYNNVLTPKTKRSKKKRKTIYDLTNARNRDMYTNYRIYDTEKRNDNDDELKLLIDTNRESCEDELTSWIDFKKSYSKFINLGFSEEEARTMAEEELK